MMKRVLALNIPFLSTDRLRRSHSARCSGLQHSLLHPANDTPVVTVSPRGRTLHVAHVNQAAYERGVRPGQPLADARAMAADIVTYDDDPIAERRQLESLAIWAGCLSPIVHIEDDNTLIADVTGCERLFKGETNLLRLAIEGLEGQGFNVRGAIADTLGGAWAIAHAHPDRAVIAEPGQTAAALAELPVWSLRIDSKTTMLLASIGVRTIGSLLYLPRSSLVSRFGEALLNRIDQSLGHLPEVMTPYRPRPVISSRFHLGVPTAQLDRLSEAVRRALEQLCRQLEQRVSGVRQMFVTFCCPDVMTEAGPQMRAVTLNLDLSRPTRSVNHLFSLLTVLLDKLYLPAPADLLLLWAREIDSLDHRQEELFATDSRHSRERSDLLDRLAVRLGPDAVSSPELLSEHQPELAFRYTSLYDRVCARDAFAGPGHQRGVSRSVTGASGSESCMGYPPQTGRTLRNGAGAYPRHGLKTVARNRKDASPRAVAQASQHDVTIAAPRPLRLSPDPIEIAVTALAPEGSPIAFRFNGANHTVVKSVGPERIETGWWRGPHIQRDYYRVITHGACHVWIFRSRDTGKWFLHGWFD